MIFNNSLPRHITNFSCLITGAQQKPTYFCTFPLSIIKFIRWLDQLATKTRKHEISWYLDQ